MLPSLNPSPSMCVCVCVCVDVHLQRRNLQGHVMVEPTDVGTFFVMLVYKNGSLGRERVRDEVCQG
ncbi:unnamed protein product, partial [Discosporangium mesarthrocarpum]